MHYNGPGLSENDSAVTTDVCAKLGSRIVGLQYSTRVWQTERQTDRFATTVSSFACISMLTHDKNVES